MNIELDTFLATVRALLQERNTELSVIRNMSNQEILAFGPEEYNAVINAKLDYISILSDFVIVTAMKVNRGIPLGDVLAQWLESGDSTGDEFYQALAQLCCQDLLDRCINLDDILDK